MDTSFITKFLRVLNFELVDGVKGIWSKKYPNHDNYIIRIDLNQLRLTDCKISYGSKIVIGRGTTSNFSQKENLVVLECVNRLLEKGYKPESIELEKGWRVGGFLDILVKDDEGRSYLMIDCKQWGKEYDTAIRIIRWNEVRKEQLFNYYLQEKSTKYVALYSSHLVDSVRVDYRNDIAPTEQFRECNNQKEVYDKWDKVFQTKGIFEEDITPYNIKFSSIKKGDLKTLDPSTIEGKEDTEGTIYNRFAEILRRHTVSDKTNAYNKIFNLFLCKIVDEDSKTSNDEEMEFQWKQTDTAETVLSRLTDLYKKGMKEYLELDVADVTEEELNNELRAFNGPNGKTEKIRQMFKQLRLYKNNEFAFKEVIDERTFSENAEVVKEVVKLLEQYQIKYLHKQQFLGEFFERLLNIGVKQEAGQFFTPIPITSFVCKSIPFEDIVAKKISEKLPDFLPYIIDYACGSGHFLTESMERVDKILQAIEEKDLPTRPQKDSLIGWKRSFKWAKKFVYGIDNDYRLAKTTKVACFLNGDGEANIVYGDGLDSFSSQLYRDRLKLTENRKDNPVFDVLIANPPYSVENFKFVRKSGEESFDLFKYVSDKSDDIECLFVERMKQLLETGGYTGVILPSGLMLNSGIHERAREIILKHFQIFGICDFGTKTFAASGHNTSILFMRRRLDSFWKDAERITRKFFEELADCSFNNIESIFRSYVSFVYPEITFDQYLEKIIKAKSLGASPEDKKSLKLERERTFYYLLTFNQRCIVTRAGGGKEEKTYLGYEHSNMKKYEGIHPYPQTENNRISSMLYSEESFDDPQKVSTYVLKNFRNETLPSVDPELEKHLRIVYLHELIDFTSEDFRKRIYTTALDNPFTKTNKYPLVTLAEKGLVEVLDNLRRPVKASKRGKDIYPYYGATRETGKIDKFLFDEKLVLIGEDGARWGEYEPTAYIITGKSWVNNHAHVIRPNTGMIIHEYLAEIFNRLDFSYLKTRPNGGKLLKGEMMRIKFPLPDIGMQTDIIKEMNKITGTKKYNVLDKYLGVETD